MCCHSIIGSIKNEKNSIKIQGLFRILDIRSKKLKNNMRNRSFYAFADAGKYVAKSDVSAVRRVREKFPCPMGKKGRMGRL